MNQEHNFNRANADYMNPALSAAERAELLLAHMTLEEKAAQIGFLLGLPADGRRPVL